jgi:hypothetical protein
MNKYELTSQVLSEFQGAFSQIIPKSHELASTHRPALASALSKLKKSGKISIGSKSRKDHFTKMPESDLLRIRRNIEKATPSQVANDMGY